MARQDIANMLTGMGGNSNKPNPNMSSADWRMAFGAQQAGAVNRAASGVSQGMFGSAPMTTPQESIAIGMGNLDLGTIGGLQTLGQMQQMRNDTAGAAKTAAAIEALKAKQKLPEQAKAVADNLPVEYNKLKAAILAGTPGALEQGIKILGAIPTPPKVESANLVDNATNESVKQIRLVDGVPYPLEGDVALTAQDLTGFHVSKTSQSARVPLIGGETTKQKMDFKRIEGQGDMYVRTQDMVGAARKNLATSEGIAAIVRKGTPTGGAGSIVSSFATAIQGIALVTGLPVPAEVSIATTDRAIMKKYAGDALMPFVEQQGRGFTDTEREYFLDNVIAGYEQPYQFNDAYASLLKSTSLDEIEQNNFAFRIQNIDSLLKEAPENIWSHYQANVPRLEIGEKKYGDSVTFEGAVVIEDNEDLSKYWSTDKGSPKGFTIRVDEGLSENKVYDWDDLKSIAARAKRPGPDQDPNMDSVREILASFSRNGDIINGVYE